MDEQRLARHQVKARIRERKRFSDSFLIAKAFIETSPLGDRTRLKHPPGFAVNADYRRLSGHDRADQSPPVPDAATHVEDRASRPKLEPAGDQLEMIEIPPIVTVGSRRTRPNAAVPGGQASSDDHKVATCGVTGTTRVLSWATSDTLARGRRSEIPALRGDAGVGFAAGQTCGLDRDFQAGRLGGRLPPMPRRVAESGVAVGVGNGQCGRGAGELAGVLPSECWAVAARRVIRPRWLLERVGSGGRRRWGLPRLLGLGLLPGAELFEDGDVV